MSASPQPPPPAPARDDPSPHSNGSPLPPSGSPAQLAALLAKALEEVDSLKLELADAKRRADRNDRILATFQQSMSPTNASPPGSSSQPTSSKPHLSDAARKAIIDAENRADHAERTRDALEARFRHCQENWANLERWLVINEARAADARAQFSRYLADGGAHIIPISALPPHELIPQITQSLQLPPPSRSHTSSRTSRLNLSSQPFPSVALPPPPSAATSRVRPRAGSMDAAGYGPALTGPGAPPPAKRPRNDRDPEDRTGAHRYSLSPSNSPHPAYLSNGHAPDRSPHHPAHAAAPAPHAQYHSYPQSRSRSERDDPRYAYPDQHHSRRRDRGRSTSRGRSSRSRSRSRGSSMSLDEMLLAATATPGEERPGPDDHLHPHARAVHQSQHLHPSSRHRSPSPGRGEYHLAAQAHHSRVQVPSPPGPIVQTYQTHIFAPPVTGAPVKKTKLSAAGSMTANGSVLTLGPTGSVISGPSAIGGGGFPPTNEQGQRICRQCGLPGRYKDGKCVEKWGPGPEGPGTVCDRCRKKMKRVERRGTLDSQNLAAQMHHPPAAIHPSGAPQAAPNGRGMAQGSDRSIHRTDTVVAHPSQSQSRLGPSGTQLVSSSSQSGYGRHDRPASPYHPSTYAPSRSSHSHSHAHSTSNSNSHPHSQRGPTPPGIATLPGSTQEEEGGYDDHAPRARPSRDAVREAVAQKASLSAHAHALAVNGRGHAHAHGSGSSRSASRSPRSSDGHGQGQGQGKSPRGGSDGKSKSSEMMDVDADADGEDVDGEAEDVDADADAEADGEGDGVEGDEGEGEGDVDADAEAELLEAVDAAEANNASEDEWMKKEDA